jgi:hypothetical protein
LKILSCTLINVSNFYFEGNRAKFGGAFFIESNSILKEVSYLKNFTFKRNYASKINFFFYIKKFLIILFNFRISFND